jgi:ketosteroid isomerase-like protein
VSGDNGEIARGYFRAWKDRDFDALRAILADDVTFRGPLGTADGAEECLRGLRGLAEIITDIVIRHVFVDGPDVLTWYDLHTKVAPPAATANWSHIENGKVTAILATFDPREIVAG